MNTVLTLAQIWVYPIKSCAGTQMQAANVTVHGLKNDRRYMVVDAATGMFVAQRSNDDLGVGIKSMCRITPRIGIQGEMTLSAPGMTDAVFDPSEMTDAPSRCRKVQIWSRRYEAMIADDDTNHWLTEFLGRERPGNYQLVELRPQVMRYAKIGYSEIRFADGYPFLVISEESLDDLNTRISGPPLPMDRFRPSIVIKGSKPYNEDRIWRMVIYGVELDAATLCERCPIPTIDQQTGIAGKEPLRTLATYRRGQHLTGYDGLNPSKVYFGRNFNHRTTGGLSVGDKVYCA